MLITVGQRKRLLTTKEKVTNYWSTWNKASINDMSDLNNSEIASRPQKHFNELIANWQTLGIKVLISAFKAS